MSRASVSRLPHSQLASSLVRLRRLTATSHWEDLRRAVPTLLCLLSIRLGSDHFRWIVRGAGWRYRPEAHLNTTSAARPCLVSRGPFLLIRALAHSRDYGKSMTYAPGHADRSACLVRMPEVPGGCISRCLRPWPCGPRHAYPNRSAWP